MSTSNSIQGKKCSAGKLAVRLCAVFPRGFRVCRDSRYGPVSKFELFWSGRLARSAIGFCDAFARSSVDCYSCAHAAALAMRSIAAAAANRDAMFVMLI
jgi:hypothetical protein